MKLPALLFLLFFLSPVLADPCLKKPHPGLCKAYIERYFYNSSTKSCDTFIWGGCGGVVPFQTLADCQIAQCAIPKCKQRPHPGPCRASIPRYFYNQTTEMCEEFTWGGCKGNVPFETFQQCQHECSTDRCGLKPDPGPCRRSFPRYFYNSTSMMCEKFIYGGCQGVVPFKTLPECEHSCEDPCTQKPHPGPCRAFFHKYFYNPTTEKCETFIWGGCNGSVPFDTLIECEKKCEA